MKNVTLKLGALGLVANAIVLSFSTSMALYKKMDNVGPSVYFSAAGISSYYLGSVSAQNKLTLNSSSGNYEMNDVTRNYGTSFQIVDENGANVGNSYNVTTEGTYNLSFNPNNTTLSVTATTKYVYFNFLPLHNGGEHGRAWQNFYCYAYQSSNDSNKNANWPGLEMTAVNTTGLYKIALDASLDTVIFNNGRSDSNDHMIQTESLTYDITKPQFACTINTNVSKYVASATPSINSSETFNYYVKSSYDSWKDYSREYGFEQTNDSSQYLIRLYIPAETQFVITDSSSGIWKWPNVAGKPDSGVHDYGGSNIYVTIAAWYNIYFKPGSNAIYIER